MARNRSSRGFSLVELLVALVFTAILMAGMATVLKASLALSTTTGEKISNIRRSRISLDLLYDDLNNAGMVLTELNTALPSSNTNMPFYIIPNVPIPGAIAGGPQTSDNLYFAYDQPLPFEGTLTSGGGAGGVGLPAAQAMLNGTPPDPVTSHTYVINCGDPTYAQAVTGAMSMQIKDDMSTGALQLQTAVPSGYLLRSVTVTTVSNTPLLTQVGVPGDSGDLKPIQRIAGSGVVFILPKQMVRYRISLLNLDPTSGVAATPCLVREQGTYDANAVFAPNAALTQVISENVAGFKVYLSADSGADWAGIEIPAATTYTDMTGWTNKIQPDLNAQLAKVGRSGFLTTQGNPDWYRDMPTLVRLDITTRSALKRSEYSSNGLTLAYKNLTQSMVLVPRHFGLTLK